MISPPTPARHYRKKLEPTRRDDGRMREMALAVTARDFEARNVRAMMRVRGAAPIFGSPMPP